MKHRHGRRLRGVGGQRGTPPENLRWGGDAYIHTQLYSPLEKAAQLYAKNESEHLTNQQHETLKNAT